MKLESIFVTVIFFGCFCYSHTSPVPTSKTILVDADTVRYYASFIDNSATVDDLTIRFGTGTQYEELLRVPIAAPGELRPQTKIRITVGMNPPVADNDPRVGITDGTNINQFALVEDGRTTQHVNPCEIHDGGTGGGTINGRSARHGNIVAGTYTMLFDPTRRFGTCSTNTGFATDGRFNAQIDTSKTLSLLVSRDERQEQYTFHYFLVEFL